MLSKNSKFDLIFLPRYLSKGVELGSLLSINQHCVYKIILPWEPYGVWDMYTARTGSAIFSISALLCKAVPHQILLCVNEIKLYFIDLSLRTTDSVHILPKAHLVPWMHNQLGKMSISTQELLTPPSAIESFFLEGSLSSQT